MITLGTKSLMKIYLNLKIHNIKFFCFPLSIILKEKQPIHFVLDELFYRIRGFVVEINVVSAECRRVRTAYVRDVYILCF